MPDCSIFFSLVDRLPFESKYKMNRISCIAALQTLYLKWKLSSIRDWGECHTEVRDRCHNSFLALVNFQCFISQIFNATFVNYQWDISQFYMTAPFSRGHKLPFIYFSPGTESLPCHKYHCSSLELTRQHPTHPAPPQLDPVKHRSILCCVDYREGGKHSTEHVTSPVDIKNCLRDILNQNLDPDWSLTISLCHKRIYKQKTFIEPPRKSNRENTKSTKQRVVRKDKHKLRKK